MKPHFTLVFLVLCFAASAQVKFKVKLLPDNSTYQVLIKSDADWAPPLNATPSAQVTIRVPTGGFTVGAVTSLAGTWAFSGTVIAPSEAPGFDYLIFGLQSPTTDITYEEGVEVAVFNFANAGSCTGAIELIEHDTDPFMPPNSENVNVGNAISAIGAGIGQNAYTGNYGAISADCTPTSNCGIEIFDIILTSPSACGVADGSIEIEATNSNGIPLQYSLDNGFTFQASPIFSNLAAGEEFEIIVRDIAAICIVDFGTFELNGPLAAIITGVDTVNPACPLNNGSVTIHATPQNGGTLQYGIGQPPVFQVSNSFTGLAAGTYQFFVRDIVNNCQNYVGQYTLTCLAPDCPLTYDLEHLGNGVYQVSMLSDTTWNFPNNITSSLQVTLKVPTGSFEVGNLTSQLPGPPAVNFGIGSTYVGPPEEPGFDYISINLSSPGTQGIPYQEGVSTPLFTFENIGECTGDSIFLMGPDDPFSAPNSQNANVSQQVFVSGAGEDIQVCLGENAAVCEAPPAACLITYELEKTGSNTFQVSMIPDVTWNLPLNITSSLQVTIKVPTGGFDLVNLTSLLTSPAVNWGEGSTYLAPPEEPNYDYLTITLGSPGTQGISYQQGVKLPLFTFENGGTCQDADVLLMDNANDPFFPPNSQNANVGQQLFTAGSGEDVQACVLNNPAVDCNDDPCTQLNVGFIAPNGCEGQPIDFTNTTTSTETIDSWNWTFGDNQTSADETPSNTYSTSGNFEVSLTVTTESGCEATFTEFVTVFPSPDVPSVTGYNSCDGAPVTLSAPTADQIAWSPATGLDDPNSPTPTATVSQTTTYTVTLTTADGCQTATDVTVTAANKPVFKDVVVTQASDCGVQDASILVSALGVGDIEYSLDNQNWTTDSLFTNLAEGDYTLFIRNANGTCSAAFIGNPLTIDAPLAPSLDEVQTSDPTGCNADGSITVIASSGTAPLLYSLQGDATVAPQQGNTFGGLMEGSYTVVVTNADGTCLQSQAVTLTGSGPMLAITTPGADQQLCEGASATVSISTNLDIASFAITGSGSFSNENTNGNTLTFDVAPVLGANTFNVQITGMNGCSVTNNFTVTGTAAPTANFTTSPTLCAGGEVTLNFSGTAATLAQISWDLDGGQQNFANGNNTTLVVSYASEGQKQVCVTVTDNGCQVTDCQVLNVTAFDPGASLAPTDPSCGASNGAIGLNLTGTGYSFQWMGPGVSASQQNQSNLPGGNYSVTITDNASGCSAELAASLNVPQSFNLLATPNDAANCDAGAGSGSIEVNLTGLSNNGLFTYQLFAAGNLTTPLAQVQSPASTATFDDLPAGAYTVSVSDANGCEEQSSLAVQSANAELEATFAAQNASCGALQDGSVSVEITAGQAPYSYDFFMNNQLLASDVATVGNGIDIANLTTGNGVILITDANDCLLPVTFTIANDPANFQISGGVEAASCGANDGSIELSGVPTGAIVSWINQVGQQIGLGNSITGLAPGIYTAQVLDLTGCTAAIDFPMTATDGAEIQITNSVDANCGSSDGSLTFTVMGGGSFSYDILGAGVGGSFGNPGAPVTVNGLAPGAYVVEITDLANNNCQSFASVVIGGSLPTGQVVAITSPVSECGVADAEICLQINGGNGPYTVTSDQGTAPLGQFLTTACVTDLYDGTVNLTVSDGSGQCDTELSIELPEVPELIIDSASVAVVDLTCPGDLGSILSNTGEVYEIFDEFNTKVGETPWMAATPGTFTVRFSEGICAAQMEVEVDGPAAWNVNAIVTPESCSEEDGSIELVVSGGNGDYAFNWGSTPGSTEILTGLSAGFYTVTITDSEGCTTVQEQIIVDFDCSVPCDDIFLVDTFFVALQGDRTEICLPTEIVDMAIFDLSLNNQNYNDLLDACTDSTIFYGYGMLLNLGAPPYRLEQWTFRGNRETNFVFEDIAQLVNRMNLLDPLGNWALDIAESSISGGAPNSDYGSLILSHVNTATTLNLQVNTVSVDHPSIFVDDSPTHIFIAQDPANPNCGDTLYINLVPETPDSIYVAVTVGEVIEVCLPTASLGGTPEFLNNACQSLTNNAQLVSTGTTCINVQGVEVGSDLFCMEICDANGVCITVYVVIEVTEGDEFEIFNAISPNEDGINDYFRIKGIERFPNNSLVVFNRWGNRVYSKKGYTNLDPWIATYRGTHLSDGTYFYILDVEMDGKMETFSGYVEIRR